MMRLNKGISGKITKIRTTPSWKITKIRTTPFYFHTQTRSELPETRTTFYCAFFFILLVTLRRVRVALLRLSALRLGALMLGALKLRSKPLNAANSALPSISKSTSFNNCGISGRNQVSWESTAPFREKVSLWSDLVSHEIWTISQ